MSDSKAYATPAAILLGSVIIATALYLRERPQLPPAPASALAPATSVSAAAPQAVPPARAPAAELQPPAVSSDAVRQQVTEAMEKHRALLVERCWKPSVQKQPAPPQAEFVFNFGFDAAGTAVTRGIAESRTNERPGLAACVSQELPTIALSALGQPVYLEVPFKLP